MIFRAKLEANKGLHHVSTQIAGMGTDLALTGIRYQLAAAVFFVRTLCYYM